MEKSYIKTGVLMLALIVLSLVFFPPGLRAIAQEEAPQRPVYVVQEGDSLWGIATRFRVSMDDLTVLNNISDPNQVTAGTKLVIPGLEGYQGELVTQTIEFGENMRTLSRRYNIPRDMLARLNHVSSPIELYAGSTLILPQGSQTITNTSRSLVAPGQSMIELAAVGGVNPWQIMLDNDLGGSWQALPGDTLLLSGVTGEGPDGLPGELEAVQISPLPLLQGRMAEISLVGEDGLSLGGSVLGHELHFFKESEDQYIALQGVHALTEGGVYPLTISGTLADSTPFTYTQRVLVQALDYPYDKPLTVNPTTIDPAVTRPEDAQWSALTEPFTPERLWSGKFKLPSPLDQDYCLETNECWTSRYGNRRSYNGGPYNAFHTGLDIAGGTGTKIFAPADGVVVFAGPLTVRGNATIIDHGWGVYTGYMHQSEMYVKPGDRVEKGDVIGLVGGTGRVEGPHLHWEVWAGGVQVDPLDWLGQVYPTSAAE